MNLAEMRAQRQAATQPSPAPQASADPAPQASADPAPQAGKLDFNDEIATPKFEDKVPRIPWNIDIQSVLELEALVHVHARNSTFYKATVRVVESNHPEIVVGQQRCLLFYYEPHPRREQEEWGNNATKREMRKLAAGLAGADPKDTSFDANKLLGDLQKATVEANGESLGFRFSYEQYQYRNKQDDIKYGTKYAYAA